MITFNSTGEPDQQLYFPSIRTHVEFVDGIYMTDDPRLVAILESSAHAVRVGSDTPRQRRIVIVTSEDDDADGDAIVRDSTAPSGFSLGGGAPLSNEDPLPASDPQSGTSDEAARADHVHADNGIHWGSGVPLGILGGNGATYIDIDSGYIYGPKVGGVWPLPRFTLHQTMIIDDFNRANGDLAGTETLTGQIWEQIVGGAQIVGNEVNGGGTGFANFTRNIAAVDTESPNGTVSVVLSDGINGGEGPAFRVVNATNYWDINNYAMEKVVAGSATTPSQTFINNNSAVVAGDTLEVEMDGNTLTFIHNGIPRYSVTDSTHNTATKHGILLVSTSDELDDFRFSPPIPTLYE